MKTRRLGTLAAAVAVAALTAVPAVAQQGHGQGHDQRENSTMMRPGPGGHGAMGGDHGHAMMAAMAFGPGPTMLLRQHEALGLSEEQVSRLDSLRAAMHSRMEEHRTTLRKIHEGMRALADSDEPDMDRYRELLERMADARVEMAVQMAGAHRQAMDVLSPEQRSNARYGMELMHRMMQRHRGSGGHGGMMEDPPMMRERGDRMDVERESRMRQRIHIDTTGSGGGG